MARILVLEPDAEVRALYERAIGRCGHVAVVPTADGLIDITSLDAVIVEPGAVAELAVARIVRERRPLLPVVCASIYPANGFGLDPVTFLEKPFRLVALEAALATAVARREAPAAVSAFA